MKKLSLLALALCSFSLSAQNFIEAYQQRADQVSQTNINSYLTKFAALGVKTTGSVANNNAYDWLRSQYLSFGYEESQLSENAFSYGGKTTKNLILTKTGTKYPDTYVIVCGHYDTIVGPGVNDNGSGVSLILEVARILKDVPTEYSIKFINFSGEEQGLLGSQHYVSTVVNGTTPKMDIKLVFNIDQVGGVAGSTNNTITCEQDFSVPNSNNAASAQVTQELIKLVGLYSPLQTKTDLAYASDYMPFQTNGEVITGFYESNESTHPHTSSDIYANMDPVYLYQVTKAAVGAVQHFATAGTALLSAIDPGLEKLNGIQLYPNPVTDLLHISFPTEVPPKYTLVLTDMAGKKVLQVQNQSTVNLSRLVKGMYVATLTAGDKHISRKIMVSPK